MSTHPELIPLLRHCETALPLQASAATAFTYLDDHARLSAHMSKSSWMMAGSQMSIETDAAAGRAVGSLIKIRGAFLGLRLSVDEVVSERTAPARKVWKTTGTPRLIVIGHYAMGFEVTPHAERSSLRVFIDYALPESWPARWLGRLLGRMYARWCTDSMANDAMRHFRNDTTS